MNKELLSFLDDKNLRVLNKEILKIKEYLNELEKRRRIILDLIKIVDEHGRKNK